MVARAGDDIIHFSAYALWLQSVIQGLIRVRIEAAAPQLAKPEKAEGAAVLPDIVDVRKVRQMLFERETGRRQDRGFGISLPFEAEAEIASDGASSAIGGYEIIGFERLLRTALCFGDHPDR